MTRLKYVIASLVVLSSLHRFNDEEFIKRSFHGHGGGAPSAPGSGTKRRRAVPAEILETDEYRAGEYCPHCEYGENMLCNQRVHYLKSRYNASDEEIYKNAQLVARCRTPMIVRNVYNPADEPRVILHAGPHKTGTTALQAFIYDLLYVNQTVFLEDNLRVPNWDELPGVFAKEGVGLNLPHCAVRRFKIDGGNMNAGMCSRMRHEFPKFVQDAYNKSQDILIVAEDFDRAAIDFDRLRFYLQPYKRVSVTATYRRLHDWLPSWYNQIVDHYTAIYARGEEAYPSFVEWMDSEYEEFLGAHGIRVAERYRNLSYVESVRLINMHEVGKKSIEHFFCNHLKARAVCRVIREGREPSKSNIGTDHDYERLAIRAKLEGKIPTEFDRPVQIDRAQRLLKRKVKETNLALQKVCPPDALLEKVFQAELEHETTYFPEWLESQGGEEGLRQSFDGAVKKKFCSIDVDRVFVSGMLDSIFSTFPLRLNEWD